MKQITFVLVFILAAIQLSAQYFPMREIPRPGAVAMEQFEINSNNEIVALVSNSADGALGLFRGKDDGTNWERLSVEVPGGEVRSMAVNSGGFLFLATERGLFYVDPEGKRVTETAISKAIKPLLDIAVIVLTKENDLYIGTFEQGAYFSDDFGASWTKYADPERPDFSPTVRAFAFASNGDVYAGLDGDTPLYRIPAGSPHWHELRLSNWENKELVDIRSLAFDQHERLLIGTRAMGLMRTDSAYTEWNRFIGPPEYPFVPEVATNAIGNIYLGIGRYRGNGIAFWRSYEGGANLRIHKDYLYLINGGRLKRSLQTTLFDNSNSIELDGQVFNDKNASCDFDYGDVQLIGKEVRVEPIGLVLNTDRNGRFSCRLKKGQYRLNIDLPRYWEHTCPRSGDGYLYNVIQTGVEVTGIDLGIRRVENPTEILDVQMAGFVARRGKTGLYVIEYTNSGNVPFTGRITTELNPYLQFLESEPAPASIVGNSMSWDFTDLPVDSNGRINLLVRLDEAVHYDARFGICSYYSLERLNPESGEFTHLLQDRYCQPALAASEADFGKICLPVYHGFFYAPISYIVYFHKDVLNRQRLVRIVDTLSSGLDAASLEVLPGSYPYTLQQPEAHILEFVIDTHVSDGSLLTDSEAPGFVAFSIKHLSRYQRKFVIENKAWLHLEPDIVHVTNTASTRVDIISDVDEHPGHHETVLFPNPASGSLNLRFAANAARSLEVHDALGRVVFRKEFFGDRFHIPLDSLPAGIYYARVLGESGPECHVFSVRR